MSAFPPKVLLGAIVPVLVAGGVARAQTALPPVTFTAPEPKPAKPHRAPQATKDRVRQISRVARGPRAPGTSRAPLEPTPSVPVPLDPQATAVASARTGENDAAATRARILTKGAANSYTIGKDAIDRLPQGNQTTFDRAILQVPGVSQDSAASGDFHIRNEHANVQYRINGIMLPDGVSGFSQVLDTSFIRTLSLVDGALPAEYGLHTAGVIDIQTRNGSEIGGTISTYGGSRRTIIPTIEYGGVSGRWDYFFTGRFVTSQIGIENPTPANDAVHDRSRQGRYFAYASTPLDDGTRLTFMSGATIAKYQIPNTPGVSPAFTAFGTNAFDSSLLNENQVERSIFNVIAAQKTIGPLDAQISYFQRYSTLHFVPDPIGDLVFNGVASDVSRTSLVNGLQSDNAYRVDGRSTVRFGFTGNVEQASAINNSIVLPTDAAGNAIDAPFTLGDAERRTGFVGGVYVSEEYRLTNQLTLNAGLRFDAMDQYVTANQLSPRIGLVYTPTESTTIHAGYSRYFTPPELALSAPTPVDSYANTTLAPGVNQVSPVRPERSHYFDVGVTQRITPFLDVGVDGYYKIATNLLDDGQFGQALVLTAFNYDHATNEGVEFKVNYARDGFRAYGNLAVAQQKASQVSSNQYLFDPDELAYIATHSIYTDHDQLITASGGVSYDLLGTKVSVDAIYGSGLRNGFANTGTVSPYATVNLGLARDVVLIPGAKPITARFAIVNVLDHSYEIRDGSGIGVFAAQYGQRRGFFAGLSQHF